MAFKVKLFDDPQDVEDFLESTECYGEDIIDFHSCSYGSNNEQIKYVLLLREHD